MIADANTEKEKLVDTPKDKVTPVIDSEPMMENAAHSKRPSIGAEISES